MRKKTRKRSYKNTIAIGIASFASIALLSTGLAAFVLIRDAQKTVDGNFVVADVSDASITLDLSRSSATKTLRLDAALGDDQGRVQIDKESTGPVLTYTVLGDVSVADSKTIKDNLKLYYIVNIKKGGSVASGEFITSFISTGYLSLEGGPLGNQNDIKATPVDGHPNEATFTFEFGFSWGTFFNGDNPSIYFDSDTGLENYTDAEVETILTGLNAAAEYTFEIVVHAENN